MVPLLKTGTDYPQNAYISLYARTNRCYNERGSRTNHVSSSIPHRTCKMWGNIIFNRIVLLPGISDMTSLSRLDRHDVSLSASTPTSLHLTSDMSRNLPLRSLRPAGAALNRYAVLQQSQQPGAQLLPL